MRSVAFRPPLELVGSVVALVPVGPEHLAGLRSAAEDPEMFRYFRGGDLTQPGQLERVIDRQLAAQRAGTELPFVVGELPDRRPIGMTRFLNLRREDDSVEVGGSWLARSRWGTRSNPEAKFLLLRYAFETAGCHRVELKTDERNVRSRAAIERLGAVYEGSLREHLRAPDGVLRTSRYYSILAAEWPTVKARLAVRLARYGPVDREGDGADPEPSPRPVPGGVP